MFRHLQRTSLGKAHTWACRLRIMSSVPAHHVRSVGPVSGLHVVRGRHNETVQGGNHWCVCVSTEQPPMPERPEHSETSEAADPALWLSTPAAASCSEDRRLVRGRLVRVSWSIGTSGSRPHRVHMTLRITEKRRKAVRHRNPDGTGANYEGACSCAGATRRPVTFTRQRSQVRSL